MMQNYDSKNEEHLEIFEWLKSMMSEFEILLDPSEFDPEEVDFDFINERLEDYSDIEIGLF